MASTGTVRERVNRHGPVLLVGAALLVLVAVEAARHHVVSRFDVIYFLAFIATVVLHELSHGVVANWCGDDTAKRAGRLSLNPLRHVDPIGSVLLPIFLLLTVHLAFGWAKPVPVQVNRLRHPRNQSLLVGLAGPATNVVLAIAAGFAFRFAADSNPQVYLSANIDSWPLWIEIFFVIGFVNVIIAAFNLLPIPPLDGSAVVERMLPTSALPSYYRIRPLFMVLVILIVLADPSALNRLFNDALNLWARIIEV